MHGLCVVREVLCAGLLGLLSGGWRWRRWMSSGGWTCAGSHEKVDQRLRTHGITGGPGWLIDMLALTRRRLPLVAPAAAQ
jgi:hypothetical protein